MADAPLTFVDPLAKRNTWPTILMIHNDNMGFDNTVEPRNNGFQGTSCFFPVVPNSGVANLTILEHDYEKNN